MNRVLLLSLLIYGLLLTGLATLNGGLVALSLPLIIYLAAGLLYRPAELRLKISRTLNPAQVNPGQPVEVRLTITNEGSDLEEVLLVDAVPSLLRVLDGQVALLTSLAGGATIDLVYTVGGPRGEYGFSELQVAVHDRLGLFKKQTSLSAPGRFLIFPEVIKLRRVEIRPRQTRVYSGLIPARQGGPGVEFFGVREYQPGDPLRWINSRASARHLQSIFVNEFEQERIADVGLILDARYQSNVLTATDSLFEHSVRATAALADVFLNAGNRVGLFIYGRSQNWTLPGYGKVQRQRILLALARAEQGEGDVFERLVHLPTRLFPTRSQLVLISPLLRHDSEMLTQLRARGYRLLVISPDPVAFEEEDLPADKAIKLATRIARLERQLLLDQLRQADIRVLDWRVDRPLPQVVHATLSRFQRL